MTCRFCNRPWSPPPGVDASLHFCPECSPERKARAREAADLRGRTVEVETLEGRFFIRAPHDYDRGEYLKDMEKTIAELKTIGPLVIRIEASGDVLERLLAECPRTTDDQRVLEGSYISLTSALDLGPGLFRVVFSDGSKKVFSIDKTLSQRLGEAAVAGESERLVKGACEHPSLRPEFNEDAARGLDSWQVRKLWPRKRGLCPDCGQTCTVYASYMHYLAGDW